MLYKDAKEFKVRQKISELKSKLAATDYKTLKFVEGLIPSEEYESIKAEREAYRIAIREAEAELAELKNSQKS